MWGQGGQVRQDMEEEDCVRDGLVGTSEGLRTDAADAASNDCDSSCRFTGLEYEVLSPVASASASSVSSLPTTLAKSWIARCALNSVLFVLGSALIASYAVVHVHIIQEGAVFYTTWFYEWFLIPILLSLVFTAPLHRALGFEIQMDKTTSTNTNVNEPWRRLRLLEKDPTTQRLIAAVGLCYLLYIVGDAAFFIPLSPNHSKPATYPTYLLALVFNIGFIYQGFLLTILTMRAIIVRLNELEEDVTKVLQRHTLSTNSNSNSNGSSTCVVTRQQILQWTHSYQILRQDMQSLSDHFGLRMVLGLSMFIVEVTNTILKVWDAVGSSLTKLQTCLLLLTYASSAAVLIMTTFQTAYTSTTCCENIGPRLAMLSLRTNNLSIGIGDGHQYDVKAELNVLAQTLMQAPIRLRIGNFHITAEYANALAAWFFGLLLVVFGMKLPNY